MNLQSVPHTLTFQVLPGEHAQKSALVSYLRLKGSPVPTKQQYDARRGQHHPSKGIGSIDGLTTRRYNTHELRNSYICIRGDSSHSTTTMLLSDPPCGSTPLICGSFEK